MALIVALFLIVKTPFLCFGFALINKKCLRIDVDCYLKGKFLLHSNGITVLINSSSYTVNWGNLNDKENRFIKKCSIYELKSIFPVHIIFVNYSLNLNLSRAFN